MEGAHRRPLTTGPSEGMWLSATLDTPVGLGGGWGFHVRHLNCEIRLQDRHCPISDPCTGFGVGE